MVFKAKAKGNLGERQVAHLLTDLTDCAWYRVPGSGNCATGDMDFKGDVYCKDSPYLGIVIEVKNYKGHVTINDLFNSKSTFWSWVAQVKGDCGKDAEGYLFFKSGGKWFWYHHYAGGTMILHPEFRSRLRAVSIPFFGKSLGMIDKGRL